MQHFTYRVVLPLVGDATCMCRGPPDICWLYKHSCTPKVCVQVYIATHMYMPTHVHGSTCAYTHTIYTHWLTLGSLAWMWRVPPPTLTGTRGWGGVTELAEGRAGTLEVQAYVSGGHTEMTARTIIGQTWKVARQSCKHNRWEYEENEGNVLEQARDLTPLTTILASAITLTVTTLTQHLYVGSSNNTNPGSRHNLGMSHNIATT